jgi:hypothetical protein
MNTVCPNCRQDTGGSRFCPHCGVQVLPAVTPPPAPPVPPASHSPAAAQQGKHTGLWIAVALLALLIVAAAIAVPLLLLRGGTVKVQITKPGMNQEVSTSNVEVAVDVTNSDKVGWVAVYVDGIMQDSVKKPPFETKVPSGDKGLHGLKATAYDSNGKLLAQDETNFNMTGATTNGGGDETVQYKKAVAAQVNEASLLDARIRNAANQVNNQLSNKYISASLVTDVQGLYNRTVSLFNTVQGWNPPADMLDIQTQFLQICEYLETRAYALVKGAEAVNSGGYYMSEFNKGAAAKNAFDKAWPVFLNTCRSSGINV